MTRSVLLLALLAAPWRAADAAGVAWTEYVKLSGYEKHGRLENESLYLLEDGLMRSEDKKAGLSSILRPDDNIRYDLDLPRGRFTRGKVFEYDPKDEEAPAWEMRDFAVEARDTGSIKVIGPYKTEEHELTLWLSAARGGAEAGERFRMTCKEWRVPETADFKAAAEQKDRWRRAMRKLTGRRFEPSYYHGLGFGMAARAFGFDDARIFEKAMHRYEKRREKLPGFAVASLCEWFPGGPGEAAGKPPARKFFTYREIKDLRVEALNPAFFDAPSNLLEVSR